MASFDDRLQSYYLLWVLLFITHKLYDHPTDLQITFFQESAQLSRRDFLLLEKDAILLLGGRLYTDIR